MDKVFGRKWHISPPVYLTPPLMGFPLEFYNGNGAQITKMTPVSECQKVRRFYVHSLRLFTIPSLGVCVWSERNSKTISRSACYACWYAIT